MQQFTVKLIVLLLLSAGIYYIAGLYLPESWYYDSFAWIPAVISIVTAFFHYGLLRRAGDSKQFIRYYMGATGIKLFLYMILIIVIAFLNKESAVSFALCFFFFYLTFTIYEVAEAYQQFGSKKGTPEEANAGSDKQ